MKTIRSDSRTPATVTPGGKLERLNEKWTLIRRRRTIYTALLLLIASAQAHAGILTGRQQSGEPKPPGAQTEVAGIRRTRALRTTDPIRIDGVLSEAVWNQAAP